MGRLTATSQDLDLEWLRGPEVPLEGPHPLMLADLERIQSELLEMYRTLFALSEEHYDVAPDDASCGLEETERRVSGG